MARYRKVKLNGNQSYQKILMGFLFQEGHRIIFST
jgi:hypothetical protein